jgi:hypothetical protein
MEAKQKIAKKFQEMRQKANKHREKFMKNPYTHTKLKKNYIEKEQQLQTRIKNQLKLSHQRLNHQEWSKHERKINKSKRKKLKILEQERLKEQKKIFLQNSKFSYKDEAK